MYLHSEEKSYFHHSHAAVVSRMNPPLTEQSRILLFLLWVGGTGREYVGSRINQEVRVLPSTGRDLERDALLSGFLSPSMAVLLKGLAWILISSEVFCFYFHFSFQF